MCSSYNLKSCPESCVLYGPLGRLQNCQMRAVCLRTWKNSKRIWNLACVQLAEAQRYLRG